MTELSVGIAFGDPLSTDVPPSRRDVPLVPSLQPFSFLHASERQLVGPRATDKRRGDFVRGRWIAKRVISTLSGVSFGPAIRVLRDSRGVPSVDLDGSQESAIRASISHTAGLAAAAAVRAPFNVGVDVERWLQMPAAIARDYFTQGEVEMYERQENKPCAAAVIWSLKESMLKVLGEGLRMSTQQVEVLGWTPGTDTDWGEARVRAPTPTDERMRAWVHEDEGWVLTVAILEPPGESIGDQPAKIRRCPFSKSDLES